MARVIQIDLATPEDCRRIAEIQVYGWQAVYRGIIPDGFLNALDVEKRLPVWKRFVLEGTGTLLVSRLADVVTGFCHLIPSRDADADGTAEIAAIYVDPNHWRGGNGKRLFRAALDIAIKQEFRDLTLWVVAGNPRGRSFYESMGMTTDGATKTEQRPGFRLEEVRYRMVLPFT